MRKIIVLLAGLALVSWTGCYRDLEEDDNDNAAEANENSSAQVDDNGNGDGSGGTTPEEGVAELARFDSEDELEDYFESQILAHNSGFGEYGRGEDADLAAEPVMDQGVGDGDAAAPPPSGGEGEGEGEGEASGAENGDFSQTTIQEEGVDEADVVKTDGDYLYVMTGEELRIVQATPPAELQLLSTFELEGYGRDLYLVGDLAVALTASSEVFYAVDIGVATVDAEPAVAEDQADTESGGEPPSVEDVSGDNDNAEPDTAAEPPTPGPGPWYRPRPQTVVTIIDVSDRTAPVQASQTVFDGSIAASRMIDGVLRLVLANHPNYYYDVLPLGASEDELALGEAGRGLGL